MAHKSSSIEKQNSVKIFFSIGHSRQQMLIRISDFRYASLNKQKKILPYFLFCSTENNILSNIYVLV